MATNRKSPKKAVKVKKPAAKATKSNLNKLIKKVMHITEPKPAKKLPAIDKVANPFNKSQLVGTIAERTDLSKKQVSQVLEQLYQIMGAHLKKGGPEKFVMPGAFKVVIRKVPAKKERKGINPFTGEQTIFKAKPASRKLRIIPLKGLKEMAQ